MKKAKKPAPQPVAEAPVVHVEPEPMVQEKPPETPTAIPIGYIWDNSSACFKKNGP